jgi:hypothetical protein
MIWLMKLIDRWLLRLVILFFDVVDGEFIDMILYFILLVVDWFILFDERLIFYEHFVEFLAGEVGLLAVFVDCHTELVFVVLVENCCYLFAVSFAIAASCDVEEFDF